MNAPSRASFIFLYILVCLIWGSTWVVIRLGHDAALPAFFAATMRFAIATAVLWLWLMLKRLPHPKGSEQWITVIVSGALGIGGSYSIVYWSSQYVDSGLAAVIFGMMPLWTMILAHWVFRTEAFTRRKTIGTFVGFTGMVLIFLPDISAEGTRALPLVMMLVAPMLSAVSLLVAKRHAHGLNAVSLNAWAFLIGGAIIGAVALAVTDLNTISLTPTHWWTILYLGIFGTVISFVVYYHLLHTSPALTMAFIAIITPVVAVVLGWLILSESFTIYTLSGSAIVLTGVWLALTDRSDPSLAEDMAEAGLEELVP